MGYVKEPIEKYIEDLAAKLPAPGGGSAAALCGALGVALLEMAANYTSGKEKYKQFQKDIEKILSSCADLRKRLTQLVDDDVAAYQKVSAAQKAKEGIEEALKEAVAVPLEICDLCHRAMLLCPELVEKGNTALVSDVGVGASLLYAGFESALNNIEINFKYMKDNEFIVKVSKVLEPQKLQAQALKEKTTESVREKLANVGAD